MDTVVPTPAAKAPSPLRSPLSLACIQFPRVAPEEVTMADEQPYVFSFVRPAVRATGLRHDILALRDERTRLLLATPRRLDGGLTTRFLFFSCDNEVHFYRYHPPVVTRGSPRSRVCDASAANVQYRPQVADGEPGGQARRWTSCQACRPSKAGGPHRRRSGGRGRGELGGEGARRGAHRVAGW